MRKVFAAFIVMVLVSFALSAKEAYYSAVINGSYLSDFAYGMLPVSLWGDFGISGIELAKDLDTKIYARLEAGLDQRTVFQDPVTGNLLENVSGNDYTVAFSDGSIVYEQGILDNKYDKTLPDILTAAVIMRMRWEQAFADFSDIRKGNYAGVFSNSDLFPDTLSSQYLLGTPELGGGKYFLSNSIETKLVFNLMDDDYIAPEGYSGEMSILFAPWFLLNKLSGFSGTQTDAFRMNLDFRYKHTFVSERELFSGRNRYSLYIDISLKNQLLTGTAVPRYLMKTSFMGRRIPPRTYMMSFSSTLWFAGPEVLSKGTYPGTYVYFENAISGGELLNSRNQSGFNFLGGFGIGADMHIMGLLRVFFEYKYIYTKIPGEKTGSDFSLGGYLTVLF